MATNDPKIKELQRLLVKAKLLEEKDIDGIYGPTTKDALEKYQSQKGLDSSLIPLNMRALYNQISGESKPINNKSLSKEEFKVLQQVVRSNLNKGKNYIEYDDYNTGTQYGDVGGEDTLSTKEKILRQFNPNYNLKTTLGQAKINIAGNDTLVTDFYDFNDAKKHNSLGEAIGDYSKDIANNPSLYNVFRKAGTHFGKKDGEGEPIIINTSEPESFADKLKNLFDSIPSNSFSPVNKMKYGGPTDSNFNNWYSRYSKATGNSPDPYAKEHYYDYEKFFNDNIDNPSVLFPMDTKDWHLPSKYKKEGHPRTYQNADGSYSATPIGKDSKDTRKLAYGGPTDPPTKKHPLDPNPDGSLPSYFEGSRENPVQLDEVTVTAEAPEWLKYRKEYINNNPFNIDEYVESRYNAPVGREAIKKIDGESWKKELKQEGLKKRYESAMDYTGEQLVKNKPQGELSRAEWLNTMSDKEEGIIKRNPKYQSSLWADTKRGLASLVEQNPFHTFHNILNSSDYSNREKQEMLKDYIDHPIMSKLGDAAKILNPLTIPSKMVQSAYKDDYSFTDALKGKKNDAGIVEDIVTDPLNLVGLGIWSKLKNTGSFSKVDDVYNSVQGLNPNQAIDKISKYLNDVGEYLTTKTVLKEAWKLNPNAYQYNLPDNTLWRGIGQEGMQDAIESGVFRAKPSGTQRIIKTDNSRTFNLGKTFDKTYYSPNFKIGDRYGQGIIAEVPTSSAEFSRRYSNKDWSLHTKTEIPIEQGRILQKDWLKGYKPAEVTKTIESTSQTKNNKIKAYGGPTDPPKEATRQDSLNVYNQAIKAVNFYKNHPDYTSRGERINGTIASALRDNWTDTGFDQIIGNDIADFYNSSSRSLLSEKDGQKTVFPRDYNIDNYFRKLDENRVLKRETASGKLNIDSDPTLYDKRIAPQGYSDFKGVNGIYDGDQVGIFTYDPIAVKPFDLLTEEEKIKRSYEYGTSGYPSGWSRIKALEKASNTKTKNEEKPKPVFDPKASFSDSLQVLGMANDYESRKKYAEKAGIKDYKGTPSQNLLLKKMAEDGSLQSLISKKATAPIDFTAPSNLPAKDFNINPIKEQDNNLQSMKNDPTKPTKQMRITTKGGTTTVEKDGQTQGLRNFMDDPNINMDEYLKKIFGAVRAKEALAYGGETKMNAGGLVEFEGPRHEQGGIQMGNIEVEGGETQDGNIVLSDRIGPKGSKLTYAELSKKIEDKYADKIDSISKRSRDREMNRLKAQQESDPQILEARAKETENRAFAGAAIGMGISAAARIANLIGGVDAPELERVNFEDMDLSEERNMIDREANVAGQNLKGNLNNSSMGIGQWMSNLVTGNAALARNKTQAKSTSLTKEAQANTAIRNQENQINTGITNQETQLRQQAEANRREQWTGLADSVGAGIGQLAYDKAARNDMMALQDINLAAINSGKDTQFIPIRGKNQEWLGLGSKFIGSGGAPYDYSVPYKPDSSNDLDWLEDSYYNSYFG